MLHEKHDTLSKIIFRIPVHETVVLVVTMIICFNSVRSPKFCKYLGCRILCHESLTKNNKIIML